MQERTNPVITKEQARKITGDREPFGIVEYEQAVALLRECLHIEDAKRFATFADAKAAWAKVAHDQTVLRLSRALKLHAARRMAEIAQRERPPNQQKPRKNGRVLGSQGGPTSLLLENGMGKFEAKCALALTRMPPEKFTNLVQARRPPALTSVRNKAHGSWREISNALSLMRAVVRTITPHEAVRRLHDSPRAQSVNAEAVAQEISEWLDEFLQRLPKR